VTIVVTVTILTATLITTAIIAIPPVVMTTIFDSATAIVTTIVTIVTFSGSVVISGARVARKNYLRCWIDDPGCWIKHLGYWMDYWVIGRENNGYPGLSSLGENNSGQTKGSCGQRNQSFFHIFTCD
jgi:hypothetical protein